MATDYSDIGLNQNLLKIDTDTNVIKTIDIDTQVEDGAIEPIKLAKKTLFGYHLPDQFTAPFCLSSPVWTDIPTTTQTFSISRAASVLIFYTANTAVSGGVFIGFLRINLDGIGQDRPIVIQDFLQGVTGFGVFEVPAGTHTFNIQAQPDGGDDNIFYQNSSQFYLVLSN